MSCYCAACGFEIPGPDECEHCRPLRVELRALREVAEAARSWDACDCPSCRNGNICSSRAGDLRAALAELDRP